MFDPSKLVNNEETALKAKRFIELMHHTKGEWVGVKFKLMDWQWNRIIRPLFGTLNENGFRQYRTAYTEVPRKNGKLLAQTIDIITKNGFKQLKNIHPGDIIFDAEGKPTRVIAESEIVYDEQCYKLTFSDGEIIIAGANHNWYVESNDWLKPHIHTTEELYTKGVYRGQTRHGENGFVEYKFRISLAKPLEFEEKELLISPYTLGAWLGDGCKNGGQFTNIDKEIIDNIRKDGYVVNKHKSYKSWGIIGLKLKIYNLFRNKHIPLIYQSGSIEQRKELLAGLMDTDGYISKAGQCEYTTILPELRDNFIELVRGLGCKPSVKTQIGRCNGKPCKECYRIQFWPNFNPFKLKRKADRWEPSKGRSNYRQIIGIEPTITVPTKCIQVDSPSGLFLAGRGLIPTHNSELAAAIGLYLLFADNELGCEVFSAAADKEQASIVFHQAAQMVRQSAVLRRHCKIIDSQKRIVVYETGSFYRVLSADAFRQHGLNAHGVIFDELHAQQKRDLWDVLTTSGGTRRQPLVFAITTAGVYDPNSVCMEQHDYAEQILAGTIDDPTFLPVIYSAPEEADWKSPDVWKACNPALRIPENPGGFRNLDEIEALCKKAVIVPAEENKFRRLYLNQWTRQIERWLPLDEWDGCKEKFDFKALERKYCFAGLDLASTSDMTAFVLLFPPQPGVDKYIIVPFFFIPEKTILEKQKVAKAPYDLWNRAGLLKTTPGKSTNYEFIEELIYSCAKKFKIKEIGYDPWQALDMVGRLEREGFEMIEVRQGKAGMNNATKELERLVLNRGIIHSGHKVLRWMINNVAVKVDPAGNISPDKENSKSKIDGVTATVMALDCATRCNKLHSIYDDGRGVIVG